MSFVEDVTAARVMAIIRGTRPAAVVEQRDGPGGGGPPVRRGRADHARRPPTPSSRSRPGSPTVSLIGAGTVLTGEDVADVGGGRRAVHRHPRGRGLHRRGARSRHSRRGRGVHPDRGAGRAVRAGPTVGQALPRVGRRPRLPQGAARPAAGHPLPRGRRCRPRRRGGLPGRGAIGVGVGSPLVGDAASGGTSRPCRERARAYVAGGASGSRRDRTRARPRRPDRSASPWSRSARPARCARAAR